MSRSFYKKRHNVGKSIPTDRLRPGMQVHLSYTNFGCVWKIVSIEPVNSKGEVWLNLIAPESGKRKRTKSIFAKYIRADEPNRRLNSL